MSNFSFHISEFYQGRDGVVVSGNVVNGFIRVGDSVRIVSLARDILTYILKIKSGNTLCNSANEGQNVDILLKFADKESVVVGKWDAWLTDNVSPATFTMLIYDKFVISDGRVAVTGIISKGSVHEGDKVMIIQYGRDVECHVAAITKEHHACIVADHGDEVGIVLTDIRLNEITSDGALLAVVEHKRYSCPPYFSDKKKQNLFSLVIEDVFEIKNRGTVVTGKISEGSIYVGDKILLSCRSGLKKSVVDGIVLNKVLVETASSGDDVGVLLPDIDFSEIVIGTKLRISSRQEDGCHYESTNQSPHSMYPHKKAALIIGNCDYQYCAPLNNCVNDANDVAAKLRELGFKVKSVLNGNKNEIDNAISNFEMASRDYDVSLVYYSGHGVQRSGVNYIVPVEALVNSPSDIDYKCVNVNYILDKMEDSGAGMRILILDACRKDPFKERLYGRSRGFAEVKGLSEMKAPAGTLISFATGPDSVASDGLNNHSPYTDAFLKMLNERGVAILNFFNKISNIVNEETNGGQLPWFSACALMDEFCFNE